MLSASASSNKYTDTDLVGGYGQCKGNFYPEDFLLSYSKQPTKISILLISTVELPKLYSLTNSGIKADKNGFSKRQ